MRIAPVTIVWYVQPAAVDEQAERVREVTRAGAMGFGGPEGRMKALEDDPDGGGRAAGEGVESPPAEDAAASVDPSPATEADDPPASISEQDIPGLT